MRLKSSLSQVTAILTYMKTDIDYSALRLKDDEVIYETTRTRELLGTPQSIFRDEQFRAGHVTGALGDAELHDATRVRLFCEANGFDFIGNIGGVFPDQNSSFANMSLPLKYIKMIPYGLIVHESPREWLEVGALRYDTASRHNPHDIRLIYAKKITDFELPRFCINSYSSPVTPHDITGLEKYETESGEFSRLFGLYIEKGRARDILAVLTPDVLAVIIDYFSEFDIEIHDNILFCMSRNERLDPKSFSAVVDAVESLVTCLEPLVPERSTRAVPAEIDEYKIASGYIPPNSTTIAKITRQTIVLSLLVAGSLIAVSVILTLLFT